MIPLEQGVAWFEQFHQPTRQDALQKLYFFVAQSHPRPEEAEAAVANSGLKRSLTPCQLMLRTDLGERRFGTMKRLPEHDQVRVFTLFALVLGLADKRRREACGANCGHWWHRDLADEQVVDELLEE